MPIGPAPLLTFMFLSASLLQPRLWPRHPIALINLNVPPPLGGSMPAGSRRYF